ncbi:MAG: hypothetical protein ACXWQE_07560 [Bdellovibrionales bacterium]
MHKWLNRPALFFAFTGLLAITCFQNCSNDLPDVSSGSSASNGSATSPANSNSNANSSSQSCAAAVENNCSLSAQASGNVTGACSTGFSGSCVATCNNGSWSMGANTCTAIDPLTPCGGTFTVHVAGNTATMTLQRSGNQISGPIVFDLYPNDTVAGTCTSTSLGHGQVQFTRTTLSPNGPIQQVFTGTWTSTDFIHSTMSGTWSWLGVDQGPWDAQEQ